MLLAPEIIRLFEKQGFVIVSTLDEQGRIHCSAKGIVGIEKEGKIFIIDLYRHNTLRNLQKDPRVSITVVDEHAFTGYTLQGKAKIVPREEIKEYLIEAWEDRIIKRISQRVLKGIKAEAKSRVHFEASLPAHPQYLIEIDVENVIDLSPPAFRNKK